MIKLDWQERDALTIKQIVAWNESTPERRKRFDRERKADERATRAAADKTKPWDAMGVSRATYYRKRETKNVRVPNTEGIVDENRLIPGNADGFSLNLRPETAQSPIVMGIVDENRLIGQQLGERE